MMTRPIVLVSACLEFDKVRYDGNYIPSRIVRDLVPYAEVMKVCPEYEIGLGVPRDPIRIVKKGDSYRLIQHNTNKDVTEDMEAFSERFVDGLGDVDGFIFKSKSPTMGLRNIKVYSGMKGSPVVERCGGFFVSRVAQKYPGYPLEEEDRLRNRKIRDNFLTRLFLFARFREARKQGMLEEFNEKNRLLLDFYDHGAASGLDPSDEGYFSQVKDVMSRHPGIEEMSEFFRRLLGDDPIIERFINNKVSLESIKEVARAKAESSLLDQTFFKPYPEQLASDAEDDRDRDYWS